MISCNELEKVITTQKPNCKANYKSPYFFIMGTTNQDEGVKWNYTKLNMTPNHNHNWDNDTMITWDYEGTNVVYLWG